MLEIIISIFTMNYKTLSIFLFVLLAVPFSAHALSLDDVVKQWMVYMRQKVATLEKENAALKEQLNRCTVTPTSTAASKEVLPEVAKPTLKVTVTADPSTVKYGGTTTIRWVAEGATSCTLNSSPVLMAPTGLKMTDNLYKTTTYTVTCINKDTLVTGSTTVTVPYSCIGNIPPANASVWGDEESTGLTAFTYWSFSEKNTSTKCQYRCSTGYKLSCSNVERYECVPTTYPFNTRCP